MTCRRTSCDCGVPLVPWGFTRNSQLEEKALQGVSTALDTATFTTAQKQGPKDKAERYAAAQTQQAGPAHRSERRQEQSSGQQLTGEE